MTDNIYNTGRGNTYTRHSDLRLVLRTVQLNFTHGTSLCSGKALDNYLIIFTFFFTEEPENTFSYPDKPASEKAFRGQKKLITRSTVHLLLNYCQEHLSIRSSYVCISLYCKKKLNGFPVLLCYTILFRHPNIKLWRLHQYQQLPDRYSSHISTDSWNFSGHLKILISLFNDFSRNPCQEIIAEAPGPHTDRLSVNPSKVCPRLQSNEATIVAFQIVSSSAFIEKRTILCYKINLQELQ